MCQLENTVTGDWCLTVLDDLKKVKIDLTLDEIKKMKKFSFKKIVKKKCNMAALKYLNDLKVTHSKLDNLKYETLEIQPYLASSKIYPDMAQQIFKWRTRMENFKVNFRNGNNDISCKLGCMEDDSQENLLNCTVIQDYLYVGETDYFKIFSRNVNQIKLTMQVILKAWHIRTNLITLKKLLRQLQCS